jgi:hypothetical protein
MDFGTTTLLEINKSNSNGSKKIAYCLPSGEFLFVTCDSAAHFGMTRAESLFGKNVFQFLTTVDAEKLCCYCKLHQAYLGNKEEDTRAPQLVQLAITKAPVWIRCINIPLTLRLLRCMDAVKTLNQMHLFTDSSSFVINEEDYSAIISNDAYLASKLRFSEEFENTNTEEFYSLIDTPLELQQESENVIMLASESLADYAFEADWASELFQNRSSSAAGASYSSAPPPDVDFRQDALVI